MIYTANKPEEQGTPKGGSSLALAESLRYKNMLKGIPRAGKENIFQNEVESSLLDEKNIKDI